MHYPSLPILHRIPYSLVFCQVSSIGLWLFTASLAAQPDRSRVQCPSWSSGLPTIQYPVFPLHWNPRQNDQIDFVWIDCIYSLTTILNSLPCPSLPLAADPFPLFTFIWFFCLKLNLLFWDNCRFTCHCKKPYPSPGSLPWWPFASAAVTYPHEETGFTAFYRLSKALGIFQTQSWEITWSFSH